MGRAPEERTVLIALNLLDVPYPRAEGGLLGQGLPGNVMNDLRCNGHGLSLCPERGMVWVA